MSRVLGVAPWGCVKLHTGKARSSRERTSRFLETVQGECCGNRHTTAVYRERRVPKGFRKWRPELPAFPRAKLLTWAVSKPHDFRTGI
jgi:hypothetical protein